VSIGRVAGRVLWIALFVGACGGGNMTCNASGKAGTCSPIASGLDPDGECNGQKTCNGAGGCS
jgi:hypothetical protein